MRGSSRWLTNSPCVVDHHPGAVELQAGLDQQRLVQLDAGAGLDRVDEQAGDGGLEVEVGRVHGRVLVQESAIVSQPACAGGSSYNPPMALPPEVCIRGAGIVGRTLALLLARERVRVALVAPPSPPDAASDVRAYALNAASKALLESLRAWPDAAHATPCARCWCMATKAAACSSAPRGRRSRRWPGSSTCPRSSSDWPTRCASSPASRSSTAPVPAPLTVVCEGRISATREALGVRYEVTRYPQHAIAARFECRQAARRHRAPVVQRQRRGAGAAAAGRPRRQLWRWCGRSTSCARRALLAQTARGIQRRAARRQPRRAGRAAR